MSRKPNVSVILPCYRVEKYIAQCLESIANQTFADFEVICVDDRGDDATLDMITDFIKGDRRFRIIRNPFNLGLSGARNVGLDHACGDYISFIDSDDWIDKNKLASELRVISEQNLPSVCSKYLLFTDKIRQEVKGWNSLSGPNGPVYLEPDALPIFPMIVWNKLYRKTCIEKAKLRFADGTNAEDLDFNFRFFAMYPQTYVLNEFMYVYRIREDSITGKNKMGQGFGVDIFRVFERCHQFIKNNGFEKYSHALLKIMESTSGQFLFSPLYRDRTVTELQRILNSIDLNPMDISDYPLLECVQNFRHRDNLGRWRYPLLAIAKIIPSGPLRRKLRYWTKLNCQ